MKIVLASPNFPQQRGNTITVKRIAKGLEQLGAETEIISTTEKSPPVSFPEADIVHGFHAYHFHTFMQKLGKKVDPYVITLTGTDINHFLFEHDTRKAVFTSLIGAKAVHVFNREAGKTLVKEFPELTDKIYSIAQGSSTFPKSKSFIEKETNTFVFVLPAGIRKVKNVPSAITMLDTLRESYSNIRLWIVGPTLEEEEGKIVKNLAQENTDWIQLVGEVPHEKMGAIYQQADIVLNTSHAEGQSAVILEAMENKIPVIASNNQGNRSIISHNKTGLLYNDKDEFLDLAEQIMNNNKLKHRLGNAARQYVENKHSSTYESKALLNIYNKILG